MIRLFVILLTLVCVMLPTSASAGHRFHTMEAYYAWKSAHPARVAAHHAHARHTHHDDHLHDHPDPQFGVQYVAFNYPNATGTSVLDLARTLYPLGDRSSTCSHPSYEWIKLVYNPE